MASTGEKLAPEEIFQPISLTASLPIMLEKKQLDRAFVFLNDAEHENVHIGESEDLNIKAIRRKVDWRVVPIMFLCYLMQSLDKTNINYAAVLGLRTDLKLVGNEFSNQATAFFVAYLIGEIWNGYALQRLPAGKWLGANVIAWGIATACTAAATNYTTLLVCRIFLGALEAAIAPSLMMISSQWYTNAEQASRFALWFCGAGLSQIIGSLIAFGFQHLSPTAPLAGWRIMFIVLGLLTIVTGIATYFMIPDSPMSAGFLSKAEKVALLNHISKNRTGVYQQKMDVSQLKELFFDVQLWLFTVLSLLTAISSGFVLTYSSTIISSFGYTVATTTLLGIPAGAVSLLSNLISGYGIRYFSHRWVWVSICCLFGLIGGALMSYAPSTNRAALLTGVNLVNTMTATLVLEFQWVTANFAGHTKKVSARAWIAATVAIGSLIAPQTFQARDAPEYKPAKIAVMATQAASVGVCAIMFVYYLWQNRRKERQQAQRDAGASEMQHVEDLWGNLTDKGNVSFRYSY